MDLQKVNLYLMENNKFLPSDQIQSLKDRLVEVPEEEWTSIACISYKDPMVAACLQLLGFGRFYVGDAAIGAMEIGGMLILYFTCCLFSSILSVFLLGLPIWLLCIGIPMLLWIDIIFVTKRARQVNMDALNGALSVIGV